MAHMWRLASRNSRFCFPLAASALISQSQQESSNNRRVKCDSEPSEKLDPALDSSLPPTVTRKETETTTVKKSGFQTDLTGTYHGLFPKSQKWEPKVEYPLWDHDWDGRTPPPTGDEDEDRRLMRKIRKTGVTRHIILIRHGQYDETHKEDEMRRLTPLGRYQAEQTGKRLASMMESDQSGELAGCNIKSLRVSGMTRAIETADIIASYLPGVTYEKPDPILNEGRPCHHVPGNPASGKIIKATEEGHKRIEAAFEKYFYRADMPQEEEEHDDDSEAEEKHEFEVIVCHANVIRYFLCRALQLPPEAWLRYCPFNCSLTYITIRSTGSVSCRMVGDAGHLAYDSSSFSMHQGYAW